MLSSLFSSVLSKALRKYFKGFESRNIKFSLSGEVDLLDLELEETALDDLHLPLKIKQGYVGKLQLIVPWQNLGEHSTIVRVSDVLIILGPKSFDEYTDESEKVHKRKATQSRLNTFTSFLTNRRKHVDQDEEKPHSHDSFVKRLISTITNNLQLYVDNIHIRYEDDLTNPLRPFSIGMTLEHFAIESADGTWRPIVGRTEDEVVHKLFTLKHMAVYWDAYNSFMNPSNVMELKAKMYSSIYSTINKAKHNFILEPLSAEIKLVWNREDMLKKDIPKSAGKLLVDKFALNLREDQYKDLILLLSRITAWSQGKKFHKLRPTVPVREAPGKWWDYATNAVLDQYRERRKKWSWTYIKQRQDDKRSYTKIWRRVKLGVSLSGTEEDLLTQIEDRYSYEDILYFRTLAELYLKREEQEKGRKQLLEEEKGAEDDKQNSLFSWMGGWVKSKFVHKKAEQAAPHLVDNESDKLNEDEWRTLYKSLNYQEDLHEIDSFKAPQSIEFTMNALIINTSIMLRTQLGEPLMGCLLESFQFSADVKDKWITLKAELAGMQAHDYFTPNTRFKNIIFTNNEVKNIFSMQFDINPANLNADYALDISSNPINIVANAQLIKRMMTFFVDPLSDAAVDFSSTTPSMPKTSVLNTMLMYKKRVYLTVDIQAPNIMVPEDPTNDLSGMLVFVLGRLLISTKQAAVTSMTSGLTDTTDPSKQSNLGNYTKQDPNDFTSMVYESNEPYIGANTTEGESSANWIKNYYDSYNIALVAVQAWVTDVSQRDSVIRQASRNEISAQHILEPFNLNLAVRSCKVNIGSLTNIIFEGSTPEINLMASSVQIRALKHIALGFMSDISSPSSGVKKTRKLVGKDVFSQAVLDVLDKNRQDSSTGSGILLEGRFFVPSISILLRRPVATEGNIIKITLERFGLKCRQTEREFVANGSLKDLIVEDLMQKFGDQYRYLVTSSRTAQKLNLVDKADDEDESQAGDKDKAEPESRPKEGPSFVFNNVNFNNVDEYHYESKIDEEIDEKNELIVLRFRNIAETSPAYQNIDNMLDVTFNSLSLIINRKTIAYLLNEVSFITYEHQEKKKKRQEKEKETTGSLSAVAREVDPQADHDNLDITSNDGSLAMTKPYKEIVNIAEEDDVAHRLFENRVTFRLGIQIKTINVLLNDHAKAMGVIQMRGMNTLMKIQNNGIFMHAVLERARVKDMTGPAKFRNIVDVRGDNVMEMDFAIAPCIEFPEVEQEYRVGVKMNSLRMIYIERFVEELASFFGVFQNLFEAAAVAVAERLEQIYKDDTKMLRFYIEMNAPMVIVPASACADRNEEKCTAGDALILQIGEVVVQNAFIKSYTMFEEISIRVQNVTMTTGKFKQREIKARDEPAEKGPLILKGLNASIDVERPINPIAIRTYGTAVKTTVAIPEAKLAITPEQISTLLDVWNDNILFMPSPELIRAQRKNAEVQRNQDKLLSKRLSEVELFEWNSLILNLEIKKLQFQIYDYQTAPEVSPEALVKLKAKGFEVNVTAASYGMTKIDLHLLTLKAEDTMKRRGDVEVVPEFREFLVPLENKKQEPSQFAQFLSGTIIMHANQHQDINLVLDGFRIIPIPELIFSIINILMPLINKLYKVLDRRTRILDLLNPIQSQIELRRDPDKKHEKDEKERQRIAAGVAMQLTLSRAQVSFVENMDDASSRGFVLNTNAVLDIAVYNYQTRIAVNTKGTEMFKCQVVKAGQGISIIEPFDIATDVTSGPQFIDVSTSLKTVRIVLSYSDIKVGAKIANQWTTAMPLMQTATPYSQTFEESKEAISSAKDKLNKAMEKKDIKGKLELSSDSEEFTDEQLNDQRRQKKMARLQEKHLDMEAKKTLDLIDQRVTKEDETVKIRQSRQAKSSGLQDPSDVRIARSVARKKAMLGVAQSHDRSEPVVVQATNVHDNPFERDFEGGDDGQHLKGSIELEEDEQVKTLMSIGRSRESRNSEDDTSSHGESREDKKAIEAEREEQEREIITLQSTTPKSTQKIVLPPYRLEILLLDDVRGYDRPLARLLVDEFTSEIIITQSTTSFLAWTRLSGSYYNNVNSAWEPFLEPWKVQAKLGGTTVQVWSTDVMNMNMTGPLLYTMKNTIEEWTEDWKTTVGNERPSTQPVNELDEAAEINKKYKGKETENAVNYQNQVNPYDITDQAMRENKQVFSQQSDNDQNQFVGDNTYDARGQLKTGKKSQQLETLAEADNQIRQRNALSNEIANANDRAVMAQTSDTSRFGDYDASDEDYEEEDAGTMESNTLRTDYYIRNVTGMPLFFSLTGKERRLLHNKKQAILMSTVADDVTGTFVRIGGVRPRQNLSIQVEGFERVDNIDLGNTGKFTINAGVNKKIVYQVKYQRGSKVIIFSSPVLLQNQTEIPLEALVSMDEEKHRFVVQPNRTVSVPLQYLTHNAEIRFRPYELGYKWSSMSFFLPNLHPSAHQLPCDLEDHYQVASSSSSSSEESSSYHHRISPNDFFLYSISIDQDTSQKFADQHIVKIRPPLMLENVLPVDIKYRIFNEQGTAFLEGTLKKGQTIPMHNLRYEQELCCSIFIEGYSWSDKEYISSARRRENAKSISVYDEKKHPLSIRIDNRFDLEGCRRVTFWSSYWLLNRTGLPLLFAYDKKKRTHRAKLVAGQSEEGCAAFSGSSRGQPKEWHVDNFFKGEPLMMSLSSDRLKRLNVFIKAANSKWSSGLAIRSIPQEGAHMQIEEAVAAHSDQPPRLYELSLIKSGAKNIFSRTEVITILPRYVLVNNTDKTLFLRQEGDAREYKLDPYEHAPFHWPHAHKEKLLRFRIDKNKCNWSGVFTIENTDYFTVQMLDEDLPKSYVMRVRIKIEQGVMIVNFVEETNNALYRIENGLPDSIFVQQQSTTSMVLHIPTGKTQSWGWLEPNQPRILDIIFPDKTVYSMKPYKLKEHTPFKYVDESGEVRDVVVQVLGLGMTRVIRIKPRSDVPNRTEKTGLEEGLEKMKVSLMFQGVGVSVVNELPEELLYLSIDGIKAEFVDMTVTRSLEVEIQDCQIDNQTLSTFTPIMMHSNTERPPQFLKFTAVKDNTYDTIQYFRYFSLLMREMWLTLDQELLLKLLSFADYIMADLKNSKKPAEGDIDEIQPLDLAVAEDDHSQMIYNQFFLLNPIAANLTFIARKGKVDEIRATNMTNILLRIPDQILPSIENAPIRLRALNLKNAYMSKNEMVTRLISFLMSQIGDQVVGVVGSLDILGNPINMFGNIGEGVHDFFYEPAKGITLGAKEFGYGLGKGSKSLAKKTVYGISDATTKITSSVSHGVAALSMDRDYQRKRRAERLGHQPSNALKGLGYGLKDFTTGIVRGITGVVEQPIKGGREEGPKGVAKGVGKGLAGLVVKPVVGTVDLFSRTAEGIRNNTQIHEKKITRKRPPRNFASLDRRTVQLREYNLYEARGLNLLMKVKEERARNQQYMFHEFVANDRVVLVSDKMIYFLNSDEVIWQAHFTNISRIHVAHHMQPPTVTIDTIDARENQRHLPCITVEQAHNIEHKLRTVCHDWQITHMRDFHPEKERIITEA